MISQRVVDLLYSYGVPDSKYLEHYIAFINKAYSRISQSNQYQEIHHRLPRSWKRDKLMHLSQRDHLITHKLQNQLTIN